VYFIRNQRLNCITLLVLIFTFTYQDCGKGHQAPATSRGTETLNSSAAALRANPQDQAKSIYGVTVDSIENAEGIALSLARFPPDRKPTTRIVLDPEQEISEEYIRKVGVIKGVSDVMLLIADSHDMHKFKTPDDYKKRVEECVVKLGKLVDIWEVGNEVNGEWAGYPRKDDESDKEFDKRLYKELPRKRPEELEAIRTKVQKQIEAGFTALDGRRTALTLYFNDDAPDGQPDGCDYPGNYCWPDICRNKINHGHEYEMFSWVNKYLAGTAIKPTYVFISYYGEEKNDCSDIKMNGDKWLGIFKKLSGAFSDAKVGIGEVGPQCKDCDKSRNCCKKEMSKFISDYYKTYDRQLKASGAVPNYVGGYFYWYFLQDMVPSTKPALTELLEAIK
jgi:hypothetical protein